MSVLLHFNIYEHLLSLGLSQGRAWTPQFRSFSLLHPFFSITHCLYSLFVVCRLTTCISFSLNSILNSGILSICMHLQTKYARITSIQDFAPALLHISVLYGIPLFAIGFHVPLPRLDIRYSSLNFRHRNMHFFLSQDLQRKNPFCQDI